ncbi:MAG TPA: beta-L-arabinofuranosidase domain-containing protein [Terriglobales bacterium]|nr:beta-L-arabinofuranosidase domain-containing protein [Terriglobales bacterium]
MSRREFARMSAAAAGVAASHGLWLSQPAAALLEPAQPLGELSYGQVTITSPLHAAQLQQTHEVLMDLSEDSLLKPFRQMSGQAAPGANLGGWYNYDPGYDWHKDDAGFAPGATFGQWISALARYYAITGSGETREKVLRLNRLYAQTISEDYYDHNRFPAYCYDKLLLGLIDSRQFVHDPRAFQMLEQTTKAALPHLPPKAIDREMEWRLGKDQSYRWDESYTNPENLFLAYQRGAGERYREMGVRYLDDDSWFDPLSRGENVLGGKHAYSYVNSLSSAMQAYLTLGSEKHLRAATNAFAMLTAQSFATGGWGPDEMLEAPNSGKLRASLSGTHNSFETPCGAYAHFKITRYLLRVSRDSRYGDSMERVMYNTVLGAKPMHRDGRAFYYADYNDAGKKVYSSHGFPCCSGTLPQVAADYHISTYFLDSSGIFVNLYLRSLVRWNQYGARVSLGQTGAYPFEDFVSFELNTSAPREFAIHFRIPEWAQGARLAVNGKLWRGPTEPGRFAVVSRRWRNLDRVELQLPRKMRLQAIDPQHPETVALLCGPLVLFAVAGNIRQSRVTQNQLLAASQTNQESWTAPTSAAPRKLLPYVGIGEEQYSTYLRTSQAETS